MPNRINHVKVISPHPEVVHAFLTQVCDIPEGWPLTADAPSVDPSKPLGPGGSVSSEQFAARRATTPGPGYIAGDPASRQFQLFTAEKAADFWAICISTRDIEGVYERCQQRGVPCTEITVADWNEHDDIRNFFCIVDDLMFEVIRVEPKGGARS